MWITYSGKEQAKADEQPQIKALSATPSNRDVRVHDAIGDVCYFTAFSPTLNMPVRLRGVEDGLYDGTTTKRECGLEDNPDMGSLKFDKVKYLKGWRSE